MTDAGRFFRFMHWLVDEGVLAEMRPPTAKVYLALGRRADFTTNRCEVSARELEELAGVSRRSVFSAIAELTELGIVRKATGRRRGEAAVRNAFELILEQPSPGSAGRAPGPVQDVHGVVHEVHGETVHEVRNPSARGAHSLETERETTATGDAAAVLLRNGFGEQDAERLAARYSMRQIEIAIANADALEHAGSLRSRSGYIVGALAGGWAELPAVSELRRKREGQERAERIRQQREQADAEAEARIEAEHRAALAWADELTDAELRAAWEETQPGAYIRRSVDRQGIRCDLAVIDAYRHRQRQRTA